MTGFGVAFAVAFGTGFGVGVGAGFGAGFGVIEKIPVGLILALYHWEFLS